MKKLIFTLFAGLFATVLTAQQSITHKTAEERLNEEYCTGLFRTSDGTVIDLSNQVSISAYFNILDWLNVRVAGLQVFTSRTGVAIPVIRGRIPGIFLDEQQVSASTLGTINIHDIAMVKVIRNPFLGGFNSEAGAIAVYTRISEEEEEE